MRFRSDRELRMDVARRRMALDKFDMLGLTVFGGTTAAALLLMHMAATPVRADTMEAALLRAYQKNPQLNAQRASVRATDEAVPQALSGYRPNVAATLSAGGQFTNELTNGA